jgi:hypothetical protein
MSAFDKRYGFEDRKLLSKKEYSSILGANVENTKSIVKNFVNNMEKLIKNKRSTNGMKRKFKHIQQSELDGCSEGSFPNGDIDNENTHASTLLPLCQEATSNPKKKTSKIERHTKGSLGSKHTGHHSKIGGQLFYQMFQQLQQPSNYWYQPPAVMQYSENPTLVSVERF